MSSVPLFSTGSRIARTDLKSGGSRRRGGAAGFAARVAVATISAGASTRTGRSRDMQPSVDPTLASRADPDVLREDRYVVRRRRRRRRCQKIVAESKEGVHELGIEVAAALAPDFGGRLRYGHRVLVRTLRDERVEHVADRADPPLERYLLALQAEGVPAPVPALVVGE